MPGSKAEAVTEAVVPQEDGFIALAALQKTLRFWWVIALLVIAGGLVGWLAHRISPPVYEAVGHFSTSLDYVSTGPLTQYEEDTAINMVGNIIQSADILKVVVSRAAAEGISTSPVELKEASVLERRMNVWDLRVRDTDQRVAERLANIWIEEAQAVLLESYQHALQADRLDRYLRSLEGCLANAAASEPASVECSQGRLIDIQEEIKTVGKTYRTEKIAARGLFSGITMGPVEQAVLSGAPVLFNRNLMVLAGGFIGLLLAVWLVRLLPLERLPARRWLPTWRWLDRSGRG